MEAWPEKPLNSESGGSVWWWWGEEGVVVEAGSETVNFQLQERAAVRFSVPAEEVEVVGRCSALAGAVEC